MSKFALYFYAKKHVLLTLLIFGIQSCKTINPDATLRSASEKNAEELCNKLLTSDHPSGLPSLAEMRVGIYTGIFDPPQKGHEAIMRAVLQKGADGKPIDKLLVVVNIDYPAGDAIAQSYYRAGAIERQALVNSLVKGLPVETLTTFSFCNDALTALVEKKAKSVLRIGSAIDIENSRETWNWIKVPDERAVNVEIQQTANVKTIECPGCKIEPADKVKDFLENAGFSADPPMLTRQVQEMLTRRPIYQALPKEYERLQGQLYQHSLKGLVEKLPARLKKATKNEKFVDDLNIKTSALPEYRSGQSAFAAADRIISQEAWLAVLSGDAVSAFVAIEAIRWFLQGWYEGLIYPQMPYLQKYTAWHKTVDQPISNQEINLGNPPYRHDRSEYNMQIPSYNDGNFPLPLQQYTGAKPAIYIHSGNPDQALSFHAGQGVATFYEVFSRSNQRHRRLFLGRGKDGLGRIILTNVYGKDRLKHVLTQTALVYSGVKINHIIHRELTPYVAVTDFGQSIKFSDRDIAIIGFRNKVQETLISQFQVPLSDYSKLAIDQWTTLIDHATPIGVINVGGRNIFTTRNEFGDESNVIIEHLFQKGVRRFLTLGTAGGVADGLEVGDILVPSKISYDAISRQIDNALIPVKFEQELSGVKLLRSSHHGWVPAVLDETESFLLERRKQGIDALDIESRYFAELSWKNQRNSNFKLGMAYVISDLTLGETTLEQYDDHALELVNKSTYAMIKGLVNNLDWFED